MPFAKCPLIGYRRGMSFGIPCNQHAHRFEFDGQVVLEFTVPGPSGKPERSKRSAKLRERSPGLWPQIVRGIEAYLTLSDPDEERRGIRRRRPPDP